MTDTGVLRRDQRLLGQGSTRRCVLFLVLVVTLVAGLWLRAVRVLVSSGQGPDVLDRPHHPSRGPLPLDALRLVKLELARPYEVRALDNAESTAATAVAVTLLIAAVLHLGGSAWRRRRLVRIGPEDIRLYAPLRQLALRAGLRRVPAFSYAPRRPGTGAVTLGAAGRYGIALDNGLKSVLEGAPFCGSPCACERPEPARVVAPPPGGARNRCGWSRNGRCPLAEPCPAPGLGPCGGGGRSGRHGRDVPEGGGAVNATEPPPCPALDNWFRETRDGAICAAVVLHEMAHVRNRDVELGNAVRALWLAFAATTVLPYAVLLAWLGGGAALGAGPAGQQCSPLREGFLVALLVTTVYVAYTDILRHRELCADLDAVDWGADPRAWHVLAEQQVQRRMGPRWELRHWHKEPEDSWPALFRWAYETRLLRSGTRPWHTHPGWWWRIRALERPPHPVGGYGTWTQATILTGTVVALMHMLFNELAHATDLAPLTSYLFYGGAVLCVSLGRTLTVHPNEPVRPRPRPFGAASAGRTRRAVLLGGSVLLLVVLDPLGLGA
ncbi:hypothetical protein GCM10018785_73860 [Streptomyces longispororuber]|uniref:Peptidase M48 domain-containing protein n=1 Tax=Streptomyces longispororuber TaxID=68230 RepID=A0A919E0Y1_9ACTN|nr:M48 family metalloprotease [Streptomyces longispororuber]GHE99434.1 hypothetical protein GCM10018785_73860 [Streptomyces longispororuber]